MLKIEVNCCLILMATFIVSMGGSLTHADVNSVYALFAIFAIFTHVQYNSIREVLIILIGVSIVVLLSDMWALVILGRQPLG